MAESVLFSFTKVDHLLKLMIDDDNITTDLFDGITKNFRIVLVESCEDNIAGNLNNDGTLNTDVISIINGTGANDGECALQWVDGVNNNTSISVASSSVHWSLDDNTYLLKGAFLVEAGTGKVLCYSINNAPMTVKKEITLPMDGMIWSIYSAIYQGE